MKNKVIKAGLASQNEIIFIAAALLQLWLDDHCANSGDEQARFLHGLKAKTPLNRQLIR